MIINIRRGTHLCRSRSRLRSSSRVRLFWIGSESETDLAGFISVYGPASAGRPSTPLTIGDLPMRWVAGALAMSPVMTASRR